MPVGDILHPTWKGDLRPDAATRHEVINRLINEIEENHMEEDVSATSQNLLQESLTAGTTRKRHSTPDPNDIFSSLQQKFQRMAEAKQQQCQQNQVRPLRCEFDLYILFNFIRFSFHPETAFPSSKLHKIVSQILYSLHDGKRLFRLSLKSRKTE